jgi:hypothetical protein
MTAPTRFDDVAWVEFIVSRWDVTTRITHIDGRITELVASADSHYTDRNGIYFDTAAQHAIDGVAS